MSGGFNSFLLGSLTQVTLQPCQEFLRGFGPCLKIYNDVLYRIVCNPDSPTKRQLVLPTKFRKQAMTSLHNNLGHLGTECTVALALDRFYWPRMASNIEGWVKHCPRCLARKVLPKVAAPLEHINTCSPMELVCIDFLSIEPDQSNKKSILVVTDHFTRYAQAFPTKDQTATTVAKVLWEQYFKHYGLPQRLHSDQGPEFESRVIKQLTAMLGVQKSHTTPYHPQGNPQPERFNRTLLNMLGTLNVEEKANWSRHVSALVHAYNCTKHDSTGYSPYFLMFGREARLPLDKYFGVTPDNFSNEEHSKYVSGLRRHLQQAYQAATREADRHAASNKKRYDERVRGAELLPGDQVLVRMLGLKGKNKLADRWEQDPYIVIEKKLNLPVYIVKREHDDRRKTLHRNLLMPIGYLNTVEPPPQPAPIEPIANRTRSKYSHKKPPIIHATDCDDDEDDDELTLFYRPPQQRNIDDVNPVEHHQPGPSGYVMPTVNDNTTTGGQSSMALEDDDVDDAVVVDDDDDVRSEEEENEDEVEEMATSSLWPEAKSFIPRSFAEDMSPSQDDSALIQPESNSTASVDHTPLPQHPEPGYLRGESDISTPPNILDSTPLNEEPPTPKTLITRLTQLEPTPEAVTEKPTTTSLEDPSPTQQEMERQEEDTQLDSTENISAMDPESDSPMDVQSEVSASPAQDVPPQDSDKAEYSLRPQRQRRPPRRLVYDTLGEPSLEPSLFALFANIGRPLSALGTTQS